MIKNLKGSVTFPSNQISLQWDMSFEPGITAIIGDNGSGKTFTSIEVVRAMLFGKKAFRGPATDYKTFECQMDLSISSADFRIERSAKAERFLDAEGTILAVGAEAVNARIRQQIGFSLEVFDVACASVQKQSDRLSLLPPTARKKLIDDVLGLNSNELAEKGCRGEATGYRREAEALQASIIPLNAPIKPAGYLPSLELARRVDADACLRRDRSALERTINQVPLPPTVKPVVDLEDIKRVQEHEVARHKLEAETAQARRQLAGIPEAVYTVEQLDEAEAVNVYETELKTRGMKPTVSMAEAREMQERWAHIEAIKKIGDTEVHCPGCGHDFAPGHGEVQEPVLTPAQLMYQVVANTNWATPLEWVASAYVLTKEEIAAGRLALARAEDRKALQQQLIEHPLEDLSEDLNKLRQGEAEHAAYVTANESFLALSERASEARAALAALPVPDDVDYQEALIEARVYESQLQAYDRALVIQQALSASVAEKVAKAASFKEGAEALQEARADLKAFLAPALSRVASTLIFEMTGGVLSNVDVDEEMNILVDGQEIATLSGAGSTAANLALRIALGQVLTRGTFPIMILDEADSDMRPKRAAYLMECLNNLRDQLQQIIVITHKEVSVADSVITR